MHWTIVFLWASGRVSKGPLWILAGVGSAAFLTALGGSVAGGAVAGGRVEANWPGLNQGQLFEDRDLAPTTDIRSIAKAILADHLGLNRAALNAVFPGGDSVQPLSGLIRKA